MVRWGEDGLMGRVGAERSGVVPVIGLSQLNLDEWP